MKRCLAVLIAVLLALCLVVVGLTILFSFLFAPQDAIIHSLPEYETKEYYTSGGFQDYTDYAKYTYRVSEKVFTESPYFIRVGSGDVNKLLSYIENFEGWVAICEDFPSENYDFDRSLISEEDYYYILSEYDEPSKEYWNYNVYYFDLDAQILYYFHNNI